MTCTNREMLLVNSIAGSFQRHPRQVNKLFESDAEILRMKDLQPDYLLIKTDGIHEEIKEGLYEDPYLIGWMAITVTVSDLAATGADLLGLLLSLQLPKDHTAQWLQQFQKGINDACKEYQTYILGGDTNYNHLVSVTTTGVATVSNTTPLLRTGILPGDLLYSSGGLGTGNAFAYARFFDASLDIGYSPTARMRESKLIRQFASACIDTSDGLFPALSVLAEVNQAGFQLDTPLRQVLSAEATATVLKTGLPSWLFLAGPHGEYELLFTVPPAAQQAFEAVCADHGWKPLRLGRAKAEKAITFITEDLCVTTPPSEIANAFAEADGDINNYFSLLMQMHRRWSQPKTGTVC